MSYLRNQKFNFYSSNVNKMQKQLTFLFLFFNFLSFSQDITLKGIIKDNKNRGIQSASVSLLDESEDILGYNFSD